MPKFFEQIACIVLGRCKPHIIIYGGIKAGGLALVQGGMGGITIVLFLHRPPKWGLSPRACEAGEGGDPPVFGSEAGVGATCSLSSKRGSSPSITRGGGEVDEDGSLELEAGEIGDSPIFSSKEGGQVHSSPWDPHLQQQRAK